MKTIMDQLSDDEEDEEVTSPLAGKKGFRGENVADPVAQKQRELKRQEQQKKKRLRAILTTICKPYTVGARDEVGSPKTAANLRIFKDDDVQLLVRTLPVTDLETLVNDIVRALGRKEYSDDEVTATADQVQAAHKLLAAQVQKQQRNGSASKVSEKKKAAESSSAPWTAAEESMLAKGMAKFPGGVAQRWEKITELINTVGKRTEKEVLKKARVSRHLLLTLPAWHDCQACALIKPAPALCLPVLCLSGL